MANLTIRNIDEDLKRRLRLRAAKNGRSLSDEVRAILHQVVMPVDNARSLAETIHARFVEIGGVDLDIPTRDAMRDPPVFE